MRAWLAVGLAIVGGWMIPAPASARWKRFHSKSAGYSVHYPRRWHAGTVHPQPGVVFTTFAPLSGGPAIHVYVYPGSGPGTDNPMPDVGCHNVTIHGVHGKRCTALSTGAPVTILRHGGKTYRIYSDAGVKSSVYNRLANSFRLTAQHP